MNTIDTIKKFESVGFSRTQAELQVNTMIDIKAGLVTQADLQNFETRIHVRFAMIDNKFEAINTKFKSIDAKFEAINARFEGVDSKFEGIDAKIEALDKKQEGKIEGIIHRISAIETKMELIPMTTTVYIAGLLLMYMGLNEYGPMIKSWLAGVFS